MRKLLLWVLPTIILLGAGAGFAALRASKPQSPPLASEEKAWNVAVERVAPAAIRPQLELYGLVESPHVAQLSAAIGADVRAVHVLEGDTVAAGQALVTLDAREVQLLLRQRVAEVADIQAQIDNERQRHGNDQSALKRERTLLELAQRGVTRARDLARKNVGSQSSLDDARQARERQAMAVDSRVLALREHAGRLAQLNARLARAEALRDRARLDVERTEILAPFDARITAVNTAPGNRVRLGDHLITLYDLASVEVRAQIPSRYLATVRPALARQRSEDPLRAFSARATVDGQPVDLYLDRLGAAVAKGTGGVDALFKVKSTSSRLELGRTIAITVDLPVQHDVVALPQEALYGTHTIFRLADSRMQSIRVTRHGLVRDAEGRTRILVSSPELRAGDDIIATQLPSAVDGLRVRVSPAPDA